MFDLELDVIKTKRRGDFMVRGKLFLIHIHQTEQVFVCIINLNSKYEFIFVLFFEKKHGNYKFEILFPKSVNKTNALEF